MRLISVLITVLAVLVAIPAARAEDTPLGAACDDAVARGVWELALDLCSPELLPAGASAESRAHVLRGRAKAYEQTGDAERAAADIAEATQIESAGLDPTGAEAHAMNARSLLAGGDQAGALKEINAAIGGTAKAPAGYHLLRAGILRDLGQDDQALPDLDRAIALDAKNAKAYAMRASIYLARRDDTRAQADIQSATALAKNCELKSTKQKTYVFTCP